MSDPSHLVPIVALAGNPNSGKTTVFNGLTGSHAKVGNYPGVTVESRRARLSLANGRIAELLDLPGAYSLAARTAEEQVAIAALCGMEGDPVPDLLVVVIDATQLARQLYLVLAVLELRQPVVVALNMIDELHARNERVDAQVLSNRLGVPVIPICARNGTGLDVLREAIDSVLAFPRSAVSREGAPRLDEVLEQAVSRVAEHVPAAWAKGDVERRSALARWAMLSVEEADELRSVPADLRAAALEERTVVTDAGVDVDLALVGERYRRIDELVAVATGERRFRHRVTDVADRVLIHPVAGLAVFLTVMATLFELLFSASGPFIDAVDGAVSSFGSWVGSILPPGLFSAFVTEGLIAGVGAVLVFLPQIVMLFIVLGALEDSGYMARAALLMDRIMKALGLTGRAFVPLITGFACAIPAIMATRTLERRRDRMIVMMAVPLTTCSARLPVYTLLAAALFPSPSEPGGRVLGVFSTQGLLMVGMYTFGTVVALGCAAILGRTLFRGATPPLILELPPYRWPQLRTLTRAVTERSRLFVTEAGPVILVCSIVLWGLLAFPRQSPSMPALEARADAIAAHADVTGWDASTEEALLEVDRQVAADRLAHSYGGRLGRALEPAIAPLGFDWKIGIGLIGAFAAREVFVSTMGVVYGVGDDVDEEAVPLRERLHTEHHADGRRVYTPLVGLSLMVFFALAAQCMSTLAVVKRETRGWRWPMALFFGMTSLAWVCSFVVYQVGSLLGF